MRAAFNLQTGRVHFLFDGPAVPPPGFGCADIPSNIDYRQGDVLYCDGGVFSNYGKQPTPTSEWDHESRSWTQTDGSYALARLSASEVIDAFAGQARLKYITSVPGQAETYQRKEQQARDWMAASFAGDPPPFIAAEAQALGLPADEVAIDIVATADQWANVKGPAIEAARRAGKVAVSAAMTIEAIEQARDAAIAALEAL